MTSSGSTADHATPPEHDWSEVDPFDLPEWLGVEEVEWRAAGGGRPGREHRLGGELRFGDERLPCEVLGVDEAFPAPVMTDAVRVRTHQAWRFGSVVVLQEPGAAGVAVAVPGRRVDPSTVFEALARLARAVGADPAHWSVRWRLGGEGRG